MVSKRVGMFNELIKRMMEFIPVELGHDVKVDYRLVLDSHGGQVTEPYSFSVSSGDTDDRWIGFTFIERENDDLCINTTMGSIDGGSITAGPPYILDTDYAHASMENFITLVFVPKISSVFRDHTFVDTGKLKRNIDYAIGLFLQALAESTKGDDVFVCMRHNEEPDVSWMNVDIRRDAGCSIGFTVKFATPPLFMESVDVSIGSRSIRMDCGDDSQKIGLSGLIDYAIEDRTLENNEEDD